MKIKLNRSHRLAAGRSGEDGKSLVEIAIVVLIAAVVTAFALPAVANSIKAYNLRSASSHLAESISAVRALAMAKNKTVNFTFDNVSGQYGFDFNADTVPDTTDPDPPAGFYNVGTLPAGVTATFPGGAPITIIFNSRGELPIGAVAQNIVLTSSGRTATVNVNLRGRVSIQ